MSHPARDPARLRSAQAGGDRRSDESRRAADARRLESSRACNEAVRVSHPARDPARLRGAAAVRYVNFAFACIALLTLSALARAADVPFLSGRVVDEAEILSPATRERLTAVSKTHEDSTTNQVVVLTTPTIGGESIEEYATRVFATWKLGQKGKDNGVLVVVVPNDRKMRIEVGYGLEGALTDV